MRSLIVNPLLRLARLQFTLTGSKDLGLFLGLLFGLWLLGLWLLHKIAPLGAIHWLNYRTKSHLHTLAQRLGFQTQPATETGSLFSPVTPQVVGTRQGRPMRFFINQISGEKKRPWISVAAASKLPADMTLYVLPNVRSIRLAWRLAPHGAWWNRAFIAKGWDIHWQGQRNLRTGDENFDREFFVKTNNPTWAMTMLTAKVRDGLMAARQERETLAGFQLSRNWLVSVRFDADEVRYSVCGTFGQARRVDHLVAQMDFVCDLAAQAEKPAPRRENFSSNIA